MNNKSSGYKYVPIGDTVVINGFALPNKAKPDVDIFKSLAGGMSVMYTDTKRERVNIKGSSDDVSGLFKEIRKYGQPTYISAEYHSADEIDMVSSTQQRVSRSHPEWQFADIFNPKKLQKGSKTVEAYEEYLAKDHPEAYVDYTLLKFGGFINQFGSINKWSGNDKEELTNLYEDLAQLLTIFEQKLAAMPPHSSRYQNEERIELAKEFANSWGRLLQPHIKKYQGTDWNNILVNLATCVFVLPAIALLGKAFVHALKAAYHYTQGTPGEKFKLWQYGKTHDVKRQTLENVNTLYSKSTGQIPEKSNYLSTNKADILFTFEELQKDVKELSTAIDELPDNIEITFEDDGSTERMSKDSIMSIIQEMEALLLRYNTSVLSTNVSDTVKLTKTVKEFIHLWGRKAELLQSYKLCNIPIEVGEDDQADVQSVSSSSTSSPRDETEALVEHDEGWAKYSAYYQSPYQSAESIEQQKTARVNELIGKLSEITAQMKSDIEDFPSSDTSKQPRK